MAYSTLNPPALIAQGIGETLRLWVLKGTDAVTAVRVSNYISDGFKRGLRKGDLLLYVKTDASPITSQMMIVNESTTTVCDLSDGTAITATDTD